MLSEEDRAFKICSVLGGLDITRLVSSNTRSFFGGAIDDVEFVREFVSTAAKHGGIQGGISTLRELSLTLDWEARGFTAPTSTMEAGLGYVDDRIDRTIERFVSYANEPLVGDKESDLAILNSVSLIFPWIVNRKSHEANWWLEHQNGRSEGPSKEPFLFDSLYTAAWIGSYGDVWSYYPPLTVYEHPYNFADILTENYDSHEEEFVRPNLPENNPSRKAFFTKPYPDTAQPGLSLITAMAPIYYTGTFRNNTYSDTYLASTGLDLAVTSVSTLLDVLENKLTRQSFGILVDSDFNVVVISQTAVEMVYPSRTGFEEARVTYDLNDGSILNDRRNQTYLVSDTILQPLTSLDNADWTSLLSSVRQVELGGRGHHILPITLTGHDPNPSTGETNATNFYVMYERWQYVADWALLVFAPVDEVTSAIDVHVYGESFDRTIQPTVSLETERGDVVTSDALITNHGSLDVVVRPKTIPSWIKLPINDTVLKAGDSFSVEFDVLTTELEIGSSSGVMTFNIQDDRYPDCFYNEDLSFKVAVRVTAQDDLNQIDKIRPVGLTLAVIVMALSILFATWVHSKRKVQIIKACQPMFLVMVCFGTFLLGTAIIPLSIDDSIASTNGCDISCMVAPWLLSIGFTTVFAALFSKIWRVNKIFRNPRFQRIKVTEKDVLVPFLILLALNVCLLLAWTLVAPLHWVRNYEDGKEALNSTYGTCSGENSTASLVFGILLAVVNICALILANVQAYLARNLSDEFSESKYIAVAMALILQIFLIGIPIFFLVKEDPTARFFVSTGIIFMVSVSVLLLLFVPKFYHLKKYKEEQLARKQVNEDSRNRIMRQSTDISDGKLGTGNSSDSNNVGMRIVRTTHSLVYESDRRPQEKNAKEDAHITQSEAVP